MHGITELDRGIVGFTEVYPNPWHGRPEYITVKGKVPYEDAMKVIDYEVIKVPLAFHIPEELKVRFPNHNGFVPQTAPDKDGLTAPLMFALVRADTGNQVYEISVSDEFTVYQNREFLDRVNETILKDNPQVAIESAGTLFAGRICFTNMILDQFRIAKDDSEHITRIMFYNAFGGRAITACMHHVRIVCNNTLMLAEAQGELNKTLRKYRHTIGAPQKVANHIYDLGKLHEITNGRKQVLERLTDINMSVKDVENFLGLLIETPEGASRKTSSGRQNRRDKIEEIFAETADLQGKIAGTRYSMLQAVTAYNQHYTIPENSIEVDEAFAWWDVSTGGVRNDMNQNAFEILSVEGDIPEPKKVAEVV